MDDASLVHFHVIEPGVDDTPTLFKVTMWVPEPTRSGIEQDDPHSWREVLTKAKRLVGDHLDARRTTS
jgi:hypothetical protein